MPVLFCPQCGYNFQGSTPDSEPHLICPECGTGADLKQLIKHAEAARHAAAPGPFLLRLLGPAVVAFVAAVPPIVGLWMGLIAWLFVLIFAVSNARTLARRLAAARAMRHPDRFKPGD